MAKMSSMIHGLGWSAFGVRLSTASSKPVGVGCGCHRGTLHLACREALPPSRGGSHTDRGDQNLTVKWAGPLYGTLRWLRRLAAAIPERLEALASRVFQRSRATHRATWRSHPTSTTAAPKAQARTASQPVSTALRGLPGAAPRGSMHATGPDLVQPLRGKALARTLQRTTLGGSAANARRWATAARSCPGS